MFCRGSRSNLFLETCNQYAPVYVTAVFWVWEGGPREGGNDVDAVFGAVCWLTFDGNLQWEKKENRWCGMGVHA